MIAILSRPVAGTWMVATVDTTGFEQSNVSRHFIKRLYQFGTEQQAVRDFAKATWRWTQRPKQYWRPALPFYIREREADLAGAEEGQGRRFRCLSGTG